MAQDGYEYFSMKCNRNGENVRPHLQNWSSNSIDNLTVKLWYAFFSSPSNCDRICLRRSKICPTARSIHLCLPIK
ncbi:hypothetical protein ACHAWO_002007 [Cyclotella atomus]|uniref:LAGLIDADG homing endonuclease n=1 Tax=Cyclotella atomus TaxID=382360 RepID=A0ABD3PP49_9STRA